MFDAYVGYDIGEVDDIPKNAEEVWILAKKYSFEGKSFENATHSFVHILLSSRHINLPFRSR